MNEAPQINGQVAPRRLQHGGSPLASKWEYCGLRLDGLSLNNLVGVLAIWESCMVHRRLTLCPPILGVEAGSLATFNQVAQAVGNWIDLPKDQWSWRRKGLRNGNTLYPRYYVHEAPGGLPNHFYGGFLEFHIVYLGEDRWSNRSRRIHRALDVFPVRVTRVPRKPESPVAPLRSTIEELQPWFLDMANEIHGRLDRFWYGYPSKLFDAADWPLQPRAVLTLGDLSALRGRTR